MQSAVQWACWASSEAAKRDDGESNPYLKECSRESKQMGGQTVRSIEPFGGRVAQLTLLLDAPVDSSSGSDAVRLAGCDSSRSA